MTKPKPVNKDKIKGTIYVMPAPFLLNLTDGRYAKLTVALELAPGQSDGAAADASASSGENAAGTLPEEPLVREIVTNAVTNQSGETLVSDQGRDALQATDPAGDRRSRPTSRSKQCCSQTSPSSRRERDRDDRVRAVRADRRRSPSHPGRPRRQVDLSRLSDIPMELSVEIGRTHMTVGETLDLRVGSVVTLERLAGETADLLVNGSAIARGEVVVIDEQYGLRITEILDCQAEPRARCEPVAQGAAAQADGEARRPAGGRRRLPHPHRPRMPAGGSRTRRRRGLSRA